MDIDLGKLNIAELKELEKNARGQIRKRMTTEKRDALQAVKALAEKRGFKLTELIGKQTKRKAKAEGNGVPKPPAPVRFAHPHNPNETWSGKGKRPKWVNHMIEQGKTLDDLRIKEQPQA